ncbi:MAG TPA: hypothetical protein VNL16_00400 [Chloroflexota bacterium]|nr:hypothetical protein [Chloroflexota bacterium]
MSTAASTTGTLPEHLERGVTREASRILSEASHGRLRRTFGVLAAFAALASGWEAYVQHLRGAYDDWLMWTPIALTPPMVLAGIGTIVSERLARAVLPWLSLLVLVDGIVGFFLHLKGVARLPGGFRLAIYNITMGPPIFAPLFFLIVGLLGLLASALRPERLTDSSPSTGRVQWR